MTKVILHWLEASRSHRVLWLLKELEVPYELKVYKRDANLGNEGLKKYHPLARSPLIEVIEEGRENKVVTETLTIFKYLLSKFDTDHKLTPLCEKGQELVQEYMDFCEGTLEGSLVAILVGAIKSGMEPESSREQFKSVVNKINDFYHGPGSTTNLRYLESLLAETKNNYFVGDKLSAADIIFEFPLYEMTFGTNGAGLAYDLHLDNYPHLQKWAENVKNNIKYQEATKETEEALAKV